MTGDSVLDQHSLDAVLVESSALMKQGMALVAQGHVQALDAAIDCFDRARRLRQRLPLAAHPNFPYDLAACHLNRGEALLQVGGNDAHAAAIAAFDAAIPLLESLPLTVDTRYVRRLAIAYQHRGDLDKAIALLERADIEMPAERDELLAAVCVNLATREMARDAVSEACALAQRALELQQLHERDTTAAAAITLRARHLLCRWHAQRLAVDANPDVAAATDVAEAGLELIGHWEQAGVTAFRALGRDFFAFAADAYSRFQPHFLNDFVEEWLDPARTSDGFSTDPDLRAAAHEARKPSESAPTVVRFVLDLPKPRA